MRKTTYGIAMRPVTSFETPQDAAKANENPELYALHSLIDDFAKEMKRRAEENMERGKNGWDSIEYWTDFWSKRANEEILKRIRATDDPVDAAVLAAFMWNLDGTEDQ